MPSNTSANNAIKSQVSDSNGLKQVINGKEITSGQYLPRAEAQQPPQLTLPSNLDSTTTYLAIMLDMDAPFTILPILGPILHWVQPGLTGNTLSSSEPFIADYIAPAPPPGASPHRYVTFLYEQPTGFDAAKFRPKDGQKMGVTKRMFFSLDNFEKEAGLGKIVGCAYFTSN